MEGSCNRDRYQAGISEHLDKEGGETGDGTPGALAGERRRGLPIGDEVDAGHTHPEWCGVKRLGDGCGESASGGSRNGLEIRKGMSSGEHG